MALKRGKVASKPEVTKEEVATDTAEEEVVVSAAEDDSPPFETGEPADAAAEVQEKSEPKEEDTRKAPPTLGKTSDSKEVAAAQQTTAMQSKPSGGPVMHELAEAGYEGLELGFGSFPIIALPSEGKFIDSEDTEYGDEFYCVIESSRPKYVLKNTECKDKDEETVYTYDKVTSVDGTPLQDYIDEWKDNGWGFELKPYVEVFATLVEEDGSMGNSVFLSIPKTSRGRFSGYVSQNSMKRGLLPRDYVTRVYVGKKVTSVDYPFYPWAFEFYQELSE